MWKKKQREFTYRDRRSTKYYKATINFIKLSDILIKHHQNQNYTKGKYKFPHRDILVDSSKYKFNDIQLTE